MKPYMKPVQEENPTQEESGRPSALTLSLPILSWLLYYILGGGLRSFVLTVVAVTLIVVIATELKKERQSPNIFMGSGKTPPATHAEELTLRRRGGKGSAYFSDPSLAFGELSNFSVKSRRPVDFRQLLKEKWDVIGPFCVDDERRQIVLVETEAGFDPAFTGPFYFQSQRDNAVRVYTVPYAEYMEVIEELSNTHTDNVLLVYNTARCGSTLLSQCLDKINGMQSISEPDVLSNLAHIASEAKNTRDDELRDLCRSSVKLLCHLRRRLHPDRDGICIKFRFQMVYIADLVEKALPDAKAVFLYRNGLDVIDSMGAAFINTGAYKVIRAIGLDVFYVFHFSTLPLHLWKLMPLMRDEERFPVSGYKWLGAVSPFAFSWMSVMTYAMEAQRCGLIKCSIRYEELIKGKTDYVVRMLHKCGLANTVSTEELAANEDAARVFTRDSHGESITRSSRQFVDFKTGKMVRKQEYAYLQDHEVILIEDLLSRHGEIDHQDFIIPGTLLHV